METANSHMDDVHQSDEKTGDRLGALPEDILLDIVKYLDLCSTARISALSRRYRRIPRLLSTIKIDVYDLTPRDATIRTLDLNQIMTGYTAATKWFLAHNRDRAIKKLYLAFYLRDPYLQFIGHAVEDAAKKGTIVDLQLTISTGVILADMSEEQGVSFGKRFMSFFRDYPIAFKWLTGLTLENHSFGESDMPALLEACSKLRFLSLINCDSGPASTLEIDAPHSELLTLKLHSCGYTRVELIQVPNLVGVSCDTWYDDNPPVHFGYVPRLHTISMASACLYWQEPFLLSEWLANTKNISVMRLDFRNDMIWVRPECPKQLTRVFSALRTVNLYNISTECELDWTLFVLEAAPSLKNFYIKIFRHKCGLYRSGDTANDKTSVPWETCTFKHNNLSLLQIEGFAVEEKVTQYIRVVIERALNLKRIRLLPQDPCIKCDSISAVCEFPIISSFPVNERQKSLYVQKLTAGLPSYVQISIG